MLTRYLIDGQTVSPQNIKPLEFTIPGWVLPLLVGTFILGALVWTPVGRSLTVAGIKRGAQVSEAKVNKWLEKGET